MSGGLRNVTFRNSTLAGQRGIHFKSAVGRGGYLTDLTFENIHSATGLSLNINNDGVPLIPGNDLVPVINNLKFVNVTGGGGCSMHCEGTNGSQCFHTVFEGGMPDACTPPEPTPTYDFYFGWVR